MKDLREIENSKVEEEAISGNGWCMCIIMYVWDSFKAMGNGFESDNKNGCRRSKGE